MSKKELAEAKIQARRLRIRMIRRRVATSAVILVAAFSGLALFRSFENASTISTASAPATEDTGTSYLDQIATVFSDEDHGDDDDGGYTSSSSQVTTSTPAPVTSSQS